MATNTDAPFVILRRDAREAGQRWYFEKPCLEGHISKRMTSNKVCLQCHRERRARFRAEHPEKVKIAKTASYRRCLERDGPEKMREYRQTYQAANRERVRLAKRAWNDAHRQLRREFRKRREHRLRASGGDYVPADIHDIGKMQQWRCANPLCRKKLAGRYHIDHIVPVALGGLSSRRNLQLLCPRCNRSKGALSPAAWATVRQMLL